MESIKHDRMHHLTILEHLFKLIYETLSDLRYDRRCGYRRMQAVARMLASALSRYEYSNNRYEAMAEMERCVKLLGQELKRLENEGVCSVRKQREAEALVGEIERLATEMRESEPV